MKKIIYRFAIVITALIVGLLLVTSITYLGDESSGPIEDLLKGVQNTISKIEEDYIIKKRVISRSSQLEWLKSYRDNKADLDALDKLLLGAYDNQADRTLQPIITLEDSLETVFPLIHIYTAWGSERNQRFPADQVDAIHTLGSIPVITWEPWLNDFDALEYPISKDKTDRNIEGLKDISAGKYDAYLTKWAQDASDFQGNILLRLGHEMNDPYRYPWGPQNNQPIDFINAWKHVVILFRSAGATNVSWVWAPHLAYGEFDKFYPGDDYVDWVGTGTLNYGTVAPWSQWWSFEEIFAKHYENLVKYNKPILIAEFGSLAVGGNQAEWYQKALADFPTRFPAVKGLVFFHNGSDGTTTYQTLNWYIKDDSIVTKAIKSQFLKWPAK
ncbi:glycoside hydrolase family 26 protein [Algoriphagus aquimarinus]|uniref:Cellulase n=1 Tax=Algoriphagus aquimarinus TaxID=237018 RepID=A0A5C7AAX5_9BACT|nr:glycosyl hydrolase [Algoriphagus aquimarinus]TXE05151.1 cellulase [Algoriphagus aquimarinus]